MPECEQTVLALQRRVLGLEQALQSCQTGKGAAEQALQSCQTAKGTAEQALQSCQQQLTSCAPCPAGNIYCAGQGCANLASDPANCGLCGVSCGGLACVQGQCGLACSSSSDCQGRGDNCISPGLCTCGGGPACSLGAACTGGVCRAPCGATPQTAAPSCLAISQQCPGEVNGSHWIAPDGGSPLEVYCDLSGGGWTLVLAYGHAAGTNNPLVPGVAPLDPAKGFSHMSAAQMGRLGFGELQLYCTSTKVNRVIHFRTSNTGALNYFRGAGSNSASYWNTGYTVYDDHTGYLPGVAQQSYSPGGDEAMTNFPFYLHGTYHWGIRGEGNRWDCDDYADNVGSDTLHQVWVR